MLIYRIKLRLPLDQFYNYTVKLRLPPLQIEGELLEIVKLMLSLFFINLSNKRERLELKNAGLIFEKVILENDFLMLKNDFLTL